MQAAVLVAPSTFKVMSVNYPESIIDWQEIKVVACGVCGSDIEIYDRNPPIPKYWPGHEVVGYLDEQLVVINPLIPCGICKYCISGKENICLNARMISSHLPGGFSQYIKVPDSNIKPIQTSVEKAVCVEPLASSLHMLNVVQNIKNQRIVIIGGGTIGLLLLQLSRLKGAETVKLIARHSIQKELGEKWGSKEIKFEPDIVLVATAGDGSAFEQAVNITKPHGQVIIIGNIYNSRPLDLKWLVEHELTVKGSQRYTALEFETAINLIEANAIEVESLITHKFDLSDISLAYSVASMKNQHQSVKVIVSPDKQEL